MYKKYIVKSVVKKYLPLCQDTFQKYLEDTSILKLQGKILSCIFKIKILSSRVSCTTTTLGICVQSLPEGTQLTLLTPSKRWDHGLRNLSSCVVQLMSCRMSADRRFRRPPKMTSLCSSSTATDEHWSETPYHFNCLSSLATKKRLRACEQQLHFLDLTISAKKSCCLRIGPSCNVNGVNITNPWPADDHLLLWHGRRQRRVLGS